MRWNVLAVLSAVFVGTVIMALLIVHLILVPRHTAMERVMKLADKVSREAKQANEQAEQYGGDACEE